uniref:APC2 domain-containing protein n=1 Tax=Angiostrongylus cantonensis TaxID=6313 RepID=A0A0K0DFQ2_ANGCA
MFMDKTRVDENADTAYASTVTCSEEQFFSSVIDSVEWVASSRLGQADDVVPYHSCLHEQDLYRGLGCKCTFVAKKNCIKLYKNFTTKISSFYSDINVDVKRGVRQGDTIWSKLPTATLENTMRALEWDNMGSKVGGLRLYHHRFADDIDLLTPKINHAEGVPTFIKPVEKLSLPTGATAEEWSLVTNPTLLATSRGAADDESDEDEGAIEETTDALDALEQYWCYTKNFIANHDNGEVKAERMHRIYRMFSSPSAQGPSLETVTAFLMRKVKQNLLTYNNGFFRVVKENSNKGIQR